MTCIEMTVEEAFRMCNEQLRVLVATQDLTDSSNAGAIFVRTRRNEYKKIFDGIQTVASVRDDFVNQLLCYTEKQDIYNVKPIGIQKIVLLGC